MTHKGTIGDTKYKTKVSFVIRYLTKPQGTKHEFNKTTVPPKLHNSHTYTYVKLQVI